jgi:hypothetical protein
VTVTAVGPPDFKIPAGEEDRNPNMDSALRDLAKAYDTLAKVPEDKLGGLRRQINDAITSGANNVIAGILAGKAYREAGLPGGAGFGTFPARGVRGATPAPGTPMPLR